MKSSQALLLIILSLAFASCGQQKKDEAKPVVAGTAMSVQKKAQPSCCTSKAPPRFGVKQVDTVRNNQ